MKKIIIIFMACCICNISVAASFDCNKAASVTEKAICTDEYLSNQDDELATIYKQTKSRLGKTASNALMSTQKRWLSTRNKCLADKACIRSSYQAQIAEIKRINICEDDKKIIFPNLARFNDISKHHPLKDIGISNALKTLLKKDYKTFNETMQVIEASEPLVGDDGILRVYGAIPNLYTIAEAALIIEPTGNIYVAVLDGGEKILYYTNDKLRSRKLPKEFKTWSERFNNTKIMYMSGR